MANNIGWGNVGTNGFGSIYSRSNSGETDLAGETSPFQDASVAYSLRDLGLGATSVVRVRRSTDNAEEDFTANEITDGTLTTFCGAGDGFVSVLYDQKNNNNASQPLAMRQPLIVNNGVLNTKNTKPSILFNGTTHVMQSPSGVLGLTAIFNSYTVGSFEETSTANKTFFGISNGGYSSRDNWLVLRKLNGSNNFIVRGNIARNLDNGLVNLNQKIFLTKYIALDKISLDINNTTEEATTNIPTELHLSQYIDIGALDNDGTFVVFGNINFQELIIFNENSSSEEIKENINNHYAIY